MQASNLSAGLTVRGKGGLYKLFVFSGFQGFSDWPTRCISVELENEK
jgi:hypothetical protein